MHHVFAASFALTYVYIYIVYTFGRAPFLPREISNFLHSDDLIKVCYAFVILLSIVSLDIL